MSDVVIQSTPAKPTSCDVEPVKKGAGLSLWQRYSKKVMRLQITRDGGILIAIALATGFAALNTGNNLLFFGWGLLLASILISGILSETTLQTIQLRLIEVFNGTVGKRTPVDVEITNTSRWIPAFGVSVAVRFNLLRSETTPEHPHPKKEKRRVEDEKKAHALFQLKIEPSTLRRETADFNARRRGVYALDAMTATTAYPFGFFRKTKTIHLERTERVCIYPQQVDVNESKRRLVKFLGSSPSHQVGNGDEFFSLRPYREGDDPRKIAWKNSARTGRWTVKETEAFHTKEVLLVVEIPLAPTLSPLFLRENQKKWSESLPLVGKVFEKRRLLRWAQNPEWKALQVFEKRTEFLLAAAFSLAKELLFEEHSVGVSLPGEAIPPAAGPRQREVLGAAFARVDVDNPKKTPSIRSKNAFRIGITTDGIPAAHNVDDVIHIAVPTHFSARYFPNSSDEGAA